MDRSGTPVIRVEIAGTQHDAVIDTGFNGDLELPETLRKNLNPRFAFQALSLLAAGVTVEEDIYAVDFPFDGEIVQAEATFVDGSDVLIGTRLLRGYRLEINFAPAGSPSEGTVQLQRIPSPAP